MVLARIKQTDTLVSAALCDRIERTNSAERVFISANEDEAAYGFNDVCPGVLLTTTYRILDDRVLESHRCGAAIVVWTVNEADDLRTAARAGVDGAYTDRPDLARKIFDDLG